MILKLKKKQTTCSHCADLICANYFTSEAPLEMKSVTGQKTERLSHIDLNSSYTCENVCLIPQGVNGFSSTVTSEKMIKD